MFHFVKMATLATFAVSVAAQSTPLYSSQQLPLTNLTIYPGYRFENMVIRPNGQILTTTTAPNANVLQVDPLHIIPRTQVVSIPSLRSAVGIAESPTQPDVYYFVTESQNIMMPTVNVPSSYRVYMLDMQGIEALPDGKTNRSATPVLIANLTDAALPNGADFAGSSDLLVADSFRGLIWNVDVKTGNVSVALENNATKGIPGARNASITGVNGVKVANGSLYWTNTGTNTFWKIPLDSAGRVAANAQPTLLASNIAVDDFVVDIVGNAYICGPNGVITRVFANGTAQQFYGTANSLTGPLHGPTAARFGRLASDRYSLYISMNGGIDNATAVPAAAGIYRLNLNLLILGWPY